MARLNFVNKEAERKVELGVDQSTAEREPFRQENLEEALEEDRIVLRISDGTGNAREISNFLTQYHRSSIFDRIAIGRSAIATRNEKTRIGRPTG